MRPRRAAPRSPASAALRPAGCRATGTDAVSRDPPRRQADRRQEQEEQDAAQVERDLARVDEPAREPLAKVAHHVELVEQLADVEMLGQLAQLQRDLLR